MKRLPDDLRREVDQRNVVREQAGLPSLNVDVEIQRLIDVDDRAEFEAYFEANRHRFEHLWSGRSRGFLSNMGIWNLVRNELRREMLRGRS